MKVNLISVILPVHNQADHVEKLVVDYLGITNKIPVPCELILVINNCKDDSLNICLRLAKHDQRIRVINSENSGWGRAVRLGLKESRGDLLCYTNSARTRPQDLLLFLLYGLANPEIVIKANRKLRDNWQRRLGSLLYNLEVRTLFDLAYWDINGTPKIFPRTFEHLLRMEENGDLIDAEFNVICRQEDYPVLEVPIILVARRGGKSTTNYKSAISMYSGAVSLWKKMSRIRK